MQYTFGDVTGGNFTEFRKEDGTMRAHGDATCWKDMVADLFSKKLSTTTGRVDYDWDNNAIKFQSSADMTIPDDRVQGNQEINHELIVGNNVPVRPHIHWFQKVASHDPDILDTTEYEFTLRYRLARNGYGINLDDPWSAVTTVTSAANNVFDATHADGKAYIGQITKFPEITIDCNVSDTIQFMLGRTDALSGYVLVYFFDYHMMVDSLGSDEEIYKRA